MSTFGFAVFRRLLVATVAGALVGLTSAASAEEGKCGGDHAHHAQMMNQKGYTRTEHQYEVPDVVLTDQGGSRVALRELLADPKPIMLNFIFTTCTTICPVLSASFAQTQKELGPDAQDVRMISISIDPENDTPARLREYAQRFHAGAGWEFLTGSLDDTVTVLKAFDAYRGNKMNHVPLTFLRVKAEGPWVRMEGFASAGDLVQEYRRQMASGVPGPS
jgi:protein SCO1